MGGGIAQGGKGSNSAGKESLLVKYVLSSSSAVVAEAGEHSLIFMTTSRKHAHVIHRFFLCCKIEKNH